MPKVPVLRDDVSGMNVEEIAKDFGFPEDDGAVGEGGGAEPPAEVAGEARDLVLHVLALLDICAFRSICTGRFDGIADAFNGAYQTICNHGEVGREVYIVVYEHRVFVFGGECYPDELGHEFRSDRNPGVIDTIFSTDFGRVVGWLLGISVGDNEDLLGLEDFESSLDRFREDGSRFVRWDD